MFSCSEEKYIEKIRQKVNFWDRWGWIVAAVFIALAVCVIIVAAGCIQSLKGMASDFGVPLSLVYTVLIFSFGCLFGFNFCEAFRYVMLGVLGGDRAERLLLKHYRVDNEEEFGVAESPGEYQNLAGH